MDKLLSHAKLAGNHFSVVMRGVGAVIEQRCRRVKRWLFAVLIGCSLAGTVPLLLSVLGLAFIGLPSSVQASAVGLIPEGLRSSLLAFMRQEAWMVVLFLVSAALYTWGSLSGHFAGRFFRSKYRKVKLDHDGLKSEMDSKNIDCYKLFSNFMYSYSSHLKLTASERVSLYKLDSQFFMCVGRYSENAKFNGKPSRLYPYDQGVVAKAWELGDYQDANRSDSSDSEAQWLAYNEDKFNIPRDDLIDIKMKSRAFKGIRIKSAQGDDLAVVLFESLECDGLPFGKISRLLNDREKKNLASLIMALEGHVPSLGSAMKEGF